MSERDDLLSRADAWVQLCGSCDGGLPTACTCPTGDVRNIIVELITHIDAARPRVVTTADELDALPAGTALKQIGDPNDRDDGVLVEAWDDTTLGHRRRRWSIAGGGQRSTTDIAHGGAWLVVWSPPVESWETQGVDR